jgi:putative nucleotidyltransferase with HDIG domain
VVVLSHLITFDDLHEIVEALTTALDAKNASTCGHSERVAELSLILAQGMGLSAVEQEWIHIGAHLHDIGKIGVPDEILNKPGKLTNEEFAIIRQHSAIGGNIIDKIKVFRPIAGMVRHHHERFDGKGYPDRLRGEDIPLGARIVAIADAFDAMTTLRSYRLPLSLDEAMAEMRQGRGSQFDPAIVDVFISWVDANLVALNGGSDWRQSGCTLFGKALIASAKSVTQ